MATRPTPTAGDKTPLLFDLTKGDSVARGMLGDLCGTNYARKGSVWGYGLTPSKQAMKEASMGGVFTTAAGDAVTVVWDHAPSFAMMVDNLKPYYDAVFYVTANIISYSSKTQSVLDSLPGAGSVPIVISWNAQTHGSGWAEDAAEKFKGKIPELLEKIGWLRKSKPIRVLVVLHRDDPVTIKDFATAIIEVATLAASVIPGMPKDIITKATATLRQWITTGKADVGMIIGCALALAPDSLRKNEYVLKGSQIYYALDKKNYVGAAAVIGIDVPGLLSSFKKTCDFTEISKNAKVGFDASISSLQNMLSADAVNKLAGGLRSGQLVMDTISGQSITSVKQFQDVILGGINPQTIMTLIPQPDKIAKAILNETNDITSTDEFRAVLGLGSGIAVGDNVFDNLSVQAISSRVNDVISARYEAGIKDLQYSLSTSIDSAKREWFGEQVHANTGAQILTNPAGSGVSSNITKALPYIAIGSAAVGAVYFFRKGL